jgi:DNA-binding GntR family transcriptional regulator
VRGPSPRDVRESYAVRAELEGLAAELAASWITRSQLDRLEEAERLFAEATAALRAEGSDAAAAQASWASANDIFHEAIHAAAGNAFLQTTIEGLHRSFPRQLTWAPLMEDPQLLEENAREHRAIREALDRRSREDARRLMTAHVQRSGELVARWFERQAQAG